MRKGRVILDTVAFLWHCLMAAITPIWIGFSYMFLTGNGKGYDYDLRSEADIYVFLALIGMGQLFDAVWCERMKGGGDHG